MCMIQIQHAPSTISQHQSFFFFFLNKWIHLFALSALRFQSAEQQSLLLKLEIHPEFCDVCWSFVAWIRLWSYCDNDITKPVVICEQLKHWKNTRADFDQPAGRHPHWLVTVCRITRINPTIFVVCCHWWHILAVSPLSHCPQMCWLAFAKVVQSFNYFSCISLCIWMQSFWCRSHFNWHGR